MRPLSWLGRFFAAVRRSQADPDPAGGEPPYPEGVVSDPEARCHDLEERLRSSEERLRQRSEMLYELQKHYSVEHFSLHESMRNLGIERMRNAGMFADRDIVLSRAQLLQRRILELKERLRKYESVEDQIFDQQPIVIEDKPSEGSAK
ncbi:MAG: hypothetical protein WAK11_12695 [Candidatus Cybelea sp.]